MRILAAVWLLAFAGSALAEPPLTAQQRLERGLRWNRATRYEKAIEEFEQGYLLDGKPFFLYHMATSYDRLGGLATKSPAEVLESKQRALELYTVFVEQAPPEEPGLEAAHSRIESLRQDIKGLVAQAASQTDKLDQILAELRSLREVLLRRQCGGHATAALAP